jgi:hypothetical protein
MVSIELITDALDLVPGSDLLDLIAPVQVFFLGGRPLPEQYFPDGLKVHLYESAFEMLDLLGNIINAVAAGNERRPDAIFQGEFCYTGTFFNAQVIDKDTIRVSLQFNPAQVDDDELLGGKVYREDVSMQSFATELLTFAISTYETIIEFNPGFEGELGEFQDTIESYQNRLETEFNIVLNVPDEAT